MPTYADFHGWVISTIAGWFVVIADIFVSAFTQNQPLKVEIKSLKTRMRDQWSNVELPKSEPPKYRVGRLAASHERYAPPVQVRIRHKRCPYGLPHLFRFDLQLVTLRAKEVTVFCA
jgi:hypothetical protein